MTLNLSEMKDEPLGKHPIQEALGACMSPATCYGPTPDQTEQVVGAAADTHSSTFDVVGLSDEELDPGYSVSARVLTCSCGACHQA